MNNIQKRFLLFLVGCIGSRTGLAYFAKEGPINWLPYMGYIAAVVSISFLTIYILGLRKTGAEVFGSRIWWNDLRPVHSLLYGLFAYFAIQQKSFAWVFLGIDVIIGLFVFIVHHLREGNMRLLFE